MRRVLVRRSAPGASHAPGTVAGHDRVRLERTTTYGQRTLHGVRRLRSIAALTSFVLLGVEAARVVAGQRVQPRTLITGGTVIIGFAVAESFRSVAVYVRGADRRETELAAAARRDGVSLAANTLQHHIGNKLAVTVGYGEMLLDDPRLPPELQAHAQRMLSSAMDAAAVVRKLDRQLARIELDRGLSGPEVLDVDGSTRIDEHPSES